MICTACNKESANRRVCPYCFTPYPSDAPASRASVSGRRQTGAQAAVTGPGGSLSASAANATAGVSGFIRRQSPIVRWSAVGIVVVGLLWYFTGDDPRLTAPPGEVPANIIAAPMSRDEAIALVKQTREQALVEVQVDEVYVSYQPSTFPQQIEGQLALVQQFTRADEIVEGRKRRIFFHDPSGRIFARSDGVLGVSLVR